MKKIAVGIFAVIFYALNLFAADATSNGTIHYYGAHCDNFYSCWSKQSTEYMYLNLDGDTKWFAIDKACVNFEDIKLLILTAISKDLELNVIYDDVACSSNTNLFKVKIINVVH